ncbi:acylphosphatase [Sphingomonas sabuli]|uniref:Acylphosphatase n=1 Tax=Sphingomonas sabuli TaxID=2764186 RepID=A0A7G9L066_9SPHN|nr:acylphosphatase [Sphingomonas sabuli]QNM82015.1 acylphosphatase [Sphingomonas sabuli]
MIARRVRVTGRVQGVFFRAWTRDEARTLGLDGWVRNCADGSVEAQLEGEESAIEEMVELLNEGPPSAQVDKVAVEHSDRQGCAGFDVRH